MTESAVTFSELGLAEPLLKALNEVGYESPSPIQEQCIPALLQGQDILGQAQTGTGKTAAFALPLISRLLKNFNDKSSSATRILVLAPTRELAIQVSEACEKYAKYSKGVSVVPIYGGQSFGLQLKPLKKGAQIVVGTPGRVMDHMRRGTLNTDDLDCLVLDEADEMLRMGFIDDVEWVLDQIPGNCQIALFSATMPKEIKKVATNYLTDPAIVKIASKTQTATTIRQRCLNLTNQQKFEAMCRILEVEDYDGVITFVRTKQATTELADKLSAQGFNAEALNGDIPQERREDIVKKLKDGTVDILIGTDVVARGLDVERISHVINYDIPYDAESYIHRIGRTGRAGRTGDAILFVNYREKRLLSMIERVTKQPIEYMDIPKAEQINDVRIARFKKNLLNIIEREDLGFYKELITSTAEESEKSVDEVAAGLAFLLNKGKPFLADDNAFEKSSRESHKGKVEKKAVPSDALPLKDHPEMEMQRFCVAVGYQQDVKPGNIVGAIANEADLESEYIGNIEIYDRFSTVDLPADMPSDIFEILKKARVKHQALNIEVIEKSSFVVDGFAEVAARRPNKRRSFNKQGKGGGRGQGSGGFKGNSNRSNNSNGGHNKSGGKGRGQKRSANKSNRQASFNQ